MHGSDHVGHAGQLRRNGPEDALLVAVRVHDLDVAVPEEPGERAHDANGAGSLLVHDRDVDPEPSELLGQPAFVQHDHREAHVGPIDEIGGERRDLGLGAGPEVAGHDVTDREANRRGGGRPVMESRRHDAGVLDSALTHWRHS